MKKLFLLMFSMSALLCFTSCDKNKQKVEEAEVVEVEEVTELNVENVVSTDRQYMFLNYGKDYRWYESCILLDNYLDADTTVTVAGVSNVFQVMVDHEEGSLDTKVILSSHTVNANSIEEKHGFWVEDQPLNNEEIKLTFTDALESVYEANAPKPHSKHVVLRKELGPVAANAQYIFGNSEAQLYVDAVTGEVSTENPVYKGMNFKVERPNEWK